MKNKIIRKKLGELQNKCNFTNKQLSEFLNMTEDEYVDLLEGGTPLSTCNITNLSNLYGVSEEELLDPDEPAKLGMLTEELYEK